MLEEDVEHGDATALPDDSLCFQVYPEEDLTWQQHCAILEALNLIYGFRTKSFVKKTYGHVEPVKRILCTLNGVLVGHIAIFEDFTEVAGNRIKVAGLGMILSLKPMSLIGPILRRKALDLCAEQGYTFAISRIRNTPRVKRHLESFVWCFLDIPMIGKNTRSHDTEIVAVFDTRLSKERPSEVIECFKKQGFVRIEREIF